jgi:hypothetical protein
MSIHLTNLSTRIIIKNAAGSPRTIAQRALRMPTSIDPARLDRALHLKARRTAPGCYRITGGAGPHTVKLGTGWCDCPDHHRRQGEACKHILAARIADGDPVVRVAAEERVREICGVGA